MPQATRNRDLPATCLMLYNAYSTIITTGPHQRRQYAT